MISRLKIGTVQVTPDGSTAYSLKSLMNTASAGTGTTAWGYKPNYLIINPEGTVRVTLDGSTPTSTVGLELLDANVYQFEINDIDKVMMILAQKCNIQLGFKTGT